MLRADFGWIIFIAFLLWVFQVLRAGGRSGSGSTTARQPSGPLGGTQREGVELEELLRQLGGRLGQVGAGKAESRPKAIPKRSAPAGGTRPAEPLPSPPVVARSQAMSQTDRTKSEPGVATSAAPARTATPPRVGARQLREAVVWREVLGPPKGLQ